MHIRINEGIGSYRRTVGEIRSLIREFHAQNQSATDYEKIKKNVGKIISDYSKPDSGWILNGMFRARKNNGKPSFFKFKDVAAPEDRCVNKWGRLNSPGESMFYGSEKRDVCIYEVRPVPGDIVTIAQYEPHRQIEVDLLDLAIYETSCARKVGYRNLWNPNNRIKKKVRAEDYPKQIAISDFIVNEMVKIVEHGHEWKYKSSVAIIDWLFKETSHFDVIMYPSIARGMSDVNVAMAPHFVRDNYRLVNVSEIVVTSVSEGKVEYKFTKVMNEIRWDIEEFKLVPYGSDG